METTRIITVCAAVVEHNDKILVIQEAKQSVFGKYNIPGGRIEPNEDLRSTIIREVKEETNIDITLEGFIGIYPHQAMNGLTIIKLIFSATPQNFDLKYPSDEILNAMWIDPYDFQKIDIQKLRSNDLFTIINDYNNNIIYDLDVVKNIPKN